MYSSNGPVPLPNCTFSPFEHQNTNEIIMKNVSHATMGEAHIYAAIAKADGEVSKDERARAPYYATKSQNLFEYHRKQSKNQRRY